VLLPHARAGILTGVVLATSRAAGEVAPIMLTGVVSYLPRTPTDLRDGFMHLGNHVYVLATQSPDVDRTRPLLFGTVLVLVVATLALNMVAIVLRARGEQTQ
jgi:phosphate transport system permease protein